MNPAYEQLIQKFPAIEQNKILAPLVTFNIGGPSDLFYKLTDTLEFEPLLKMAEQLGIPVFVLGGGSNTIFADEGFRGLVIHMAAKNIVLEDLGTAGTHEQSECALEEKSSQDTMGRQARQENAARATGPAPIIVAEAGALLSQIIQFALKNNLTGMEKMMGLPGTIGGAVRGNAGAFGIELKDIFYKALIYSPEKGLYEAGAGHLNFDYRTSQIKKDQVQAQKAVETVLKVYLQLTPATPETAKSALAESLDIVKNRISKQPKGKCSGSFFKNPVTPDYVNPQPQETKVGYLLEQIGAKGMQIGGVQVSLEHANWLMNTGNGTQKDVLELSKILQQKVKKHFNIDIEREVQLVSPEGKLL
jgi:UDP-N-acetylmuramate dehydrogenase